MNRATGTSDDLRAAFASLSTSAAGGPECPSADAIWDAVTGAAPSAQASAIVEHTSRCFACAEAWRLARELGARPIAGPGALPAGRGFLGAGPGRWTALAAMAVLAAGLGVFVALRRAAPPIVMRAGEEVAIRSLVPESTPLSREGCILRWSEPAAGARYTVRVGTEDLSPVAFVDRLEQAEYAIPAKDLEEIPPGSVIVWQVEAVLPDGRRVASPGFRNQLE